MTPDQELPWLEDLIEMAQEHADQFSAAYAGYKPERHAHYAAILKRARAAAPPAQATSLADFDAWREEYVNRFDTEPIAREGWEAAKEHFAAAPLQAPADAIRNEALDEVARLLSGFHDAHSQSLATVILGMKRDTAMGTPTAAASPQSETPK